MALSDMPRATLREYRKNATENRRTLYVWEDGPNKWVSSPYGDRVPFGSAHFIFHATGQVFPIAPLSERI